MVSSMVAAALAAAGHESAVGQLRCRSLRPVFPPHSLTLPLFLMPQLSVVLQDRGKAAQGSLGQLSSLGGIPPLPSEDFVPLLGESSSVAQPSGTPPPPPADSSGAPPPGAPPPV